MSRLPELLHKLTFEVYPADPMKFFAPNIGTPGRIARGLCGVASLAAGWFSREHPAVGAALALGGGFMLFEAFRGWCVARACGLKTPM